MRGMVVRLKELFADTAHYIDICLKYNLYCCAARASPDIHNKCDVSLGPSYYIIIIEEANSLTHSLSVFVQFQYSV